jgi:MarR family transcriptional regulator for hemolysin
MVGKNGNVPRQKSVTSAILQAGSIWKRAAEKALVDEGISVARANLILWLGRMGGGVRQVQLAEAIGLASQSLVRLLDELSSLGLLERRDDPVDRRANTLWLTPEGEAMAERVEGVLATLRERVLHDVDERDIEATHRVLDVIIERGLADDTSRMRPSERAA